MANEHPKAPGVLLSFNKLEFSVDVRQSRRKFTKKTILHEISGVFKPGRLTAILGPSGGGKTSLLNCLGGLAVTGKIAGTINVNGHEAPSNVLRSICGFVHQDDVMMSTMTVSEVLHMARALRSKKVNEESNEKKVLDVISLLGLTDAKDTIIGSPLAKGVSGGERKRTAIGMELLSSPPIILLDECTSGLDTFAAYTVMKVLQEIAHTSGTTVVATLHQPASEIFEMLDDIMILVSGKVLYSGPVVKMVEHFGVLGYKCPTYTNPPDYVFMHVINITNNEDIEETTQNTRLQKLLKEAYEIDDKDGTRCDNISEIEYKYNQSVGGAILRFKYYPHVFQQVYYLLPRAFKNMQRNPLILRARFGQAIFLSIIIGVLYYNVESSFWTDQSIKNGVSLEMSVAGALFFVSSNLFISPSVSALSVFQGERPVFIREYSAGYYSVFPYFISKMIVELPFLILGALIFGTIAYWMIGFSKDGVQYIIFTCICILLNLVGAAYGTAMSTIFEDIGIGLAMLPLTFLPMMLLGGLLVSEGTTPAWLSWLKWLSPIQYSFTNHMKNYWAISNVHANATTVLENYGMNKNLDPWLNYLIMVLIFIVTTILAYFGLLRLAIKRGGKAHLKEKERKKWQQKTSELITTAPRS